jgi:hypothetical protein
MMQAVDVGEQDWLLNRSSTPLASLQFSSVLAILASTDTICSSAGRAQHWMPAKHL